MNSFLVGVNAKFIHSNLAIRSIQAYAQTACGAVPQLLEFTINQRPEYILSEIYQKNPEVLGFSCYIWNFELISRLVSELKKVLPNCFLFLGGPEVTYNAEEVLQKLPVDCIVVGEGEIICTALFSALEHHTPLDVIPGLVFRRGQQLLRTPDAVPPPMEDVPFVYDDMNDLEHRILYYESSRGCPFQCQYCLSCSETGVRFLPLERVFRDLDFFLKRRVRQVKFVDRTFNCDRRRALAIWQYLKEHDNGYTNFHFEIAAELLTEEQLTFLNTVRRGFFQFEIGVQSTNPKTLEHIKRITKLDELRIILSRLQNGGNIHLHLDLIIGLPYEGYERFGKSFDDVYALAPDQLQVGFLKLLKGSGLYQSRARYGIVCSDYAPYEVLYTDDLPFAKLLKLKMIEEMVEVYYNSNRFRCLMAYFTALFSSPFSFFEALAEFYEQNGLHRMSHTNVEYYTILHDFFQTLPHGDAERFQWYAKFDLYSHEKAKKIPDWLTVSLMNSRKAEVYRFYEDDETRSRLLPEYEAFDSKQLTRLAHIEVFPFHPLTGEPGETAILFNYKSCDLLGNAAHHVVSL